ncbi:uncharacterized protein C8A04DRAFT_36825 [Dichotomopilus funicola]|uniref:Uncharacterized protein n=1 Tax=Dichotomopilus funicola TaxID=1934379 RepID=A0AAN6V3J9_9PEZI|nr:hypothetical protein C8A04DRAFT_36825 [Dichotomopilus funicola]
MAAMQHATANLNLHAPSSTNLAPILTLPVEILIQISCSLCIHCRHPRVGEISDDEATAAVRDQTVLANLSASSRRLRAVAQPVLFHFFHPLERNYSEVLLRLSRFACTLYHRGDLATSVRSLVFWTPEYYDRKHDIREAQLTLRKVFADKPTHKRAAAELGPWWVSRSYISLDELQELTIALASGVTYVLLQRRFHGFGKTWADWPCLMEGLRDVVLVGFRKWWLLDPCGHSFHIKQAREFLRHARNLDSLVAADCGADGCEPDYRFAQDPRPWKAAPWDVELPRLRKLSISGNDIGADDVEAIIRHSTVFEDLEFCQSKWGRYILDLDKHLGTAKETLKRLCYSAFPMKSGLTIHKLDGPAIYFAGEVEARKGDSYFDPTENPLEDFEAGLSLKDFRALETLELEQLILYGPVFEKPENLEHDRSRSCEAVTTDDFLDKFPPSLDSGGCVAMNTIGFRRDLIYDLMSGRPQHGCQRPAADYAAVLFESYYAKGWRRQ